MLAGRHSSESKLEGGNVTAECFAQTVNRLKDKAVMIFINLQMPKGLLVNKMMNMDRYAVYVILVREEM
ncbi:protein of unknown function [Sterolibacterium denitrificans]|uniref:Uncharacterized protein n=1 Tax=Sterolibacterium denitrificans TaxID=157592 RepID=A0A7Z7HQW3_9PROT|nr:hypothetical protein [Sterolibacterium denitrificans]SMB26120.1 protein of unknown function [Sterolibacterium denitrificans]